MAIDSKEKICIIKGEIDYTCIFFFFNFNLARVQLGINDLVGSLFCTVLSLVKKIKNPQI